MNPILPGLDAAQNAHPLFVHFPIVLWLTALLFWGLGVLRRRDDLFHQGTQFLALGTLAAAVALVSGFVAAGGHGHEAPGHELVHDHRDLMLVASIMMAAMTGAGWYARRQSSRVIRLCLTAALFLVNGLVVLGADRGALLVYGHHMGTSESSPAPPSGLDQEQHHPPGEQHHPPGEQHHPPDADGDAPGHPADHDPAGEHVH